MSLLEDSLQKALQKNAEETSKWTSYKDDHIQCQENLQNFQQKLEVDVLVPIGTKAFMPGKLYHTSEIFVSHFQNIYSQCTTSQATDICNARIKLADGKLNALQVEYDLFRNKLDVPLLENAFKRNNEMDIIEEYDEDTERKWRERHKENVKKFKLEESKGHRKANNEDDDIFDRLDELEIIEELNNELMNVDADEVLSFITENNPPQVIDISKLLSESTFKMVQNIADDCDNGNHLLNLQPIIIEFNHSEHKPIDVIPLNSDTIPLASPASFYSVHSQRQ